MSLFPEGKDWIDLVGLIVSILGVIVGAFLTRQANRIAKSNLELANQQQKALDQKINSEDRAIFRSNYRKVIDALEIIWRDGNINDEVKNLFWQARGEARLELPKDIADYTQGLFDQMWEAYSLFHNKINGDTRLPQGEERPTACDRHSQIISQLIREQPSAIYAKYMKPGNE